MSFEDCLQQGLVRKSDGAPQRVAQSLALGDRFLQSARNNLRIMEFEVCELLSYNATFHYARGLLHAKGFIERSHACLFEALRSLYPGQLPLIGKADKLRLQRHNLQYKGFSAGPRDAEFSLELALHFGTAAKKLLKMGKNV